MKRLAAAALIALAACAHPASCVAGKLTPTYLPPGLRRAAVHPLVPGGDAATWRDGHRLVQLVTNVSANLGDDVRPTKVRGFVANYGPTGLPAAPVAVEWRDRCNTPYALLAKEISAAELLRIANGLRPA